MTAAVAVADSVGLDALSMRRVARDLGVDPMSLYRYVDGKDGLLDAMTDAVISGIEPTPDTGDWVADLRETVMAARRALIAHPWTAQVLATRTDPTPAALRHLDKTLGIMRRGGCSVTLAHHALHLLGSRILGFNQDLYDDKSSPGVPAEVAVAQVEAWAVSMPHVAELALAASHDGSLGVCDDDDEFAFAIDLILDGLERHRVDDARHVATPG